MRKLFWILLLANVALFAARQYGGFGDDEQAVQPQPALNGDLIRLLPPTQTSLTGPAPVTPAQSRNSSATPESTASPAKAPVVIPPAKAHMPSPSPVASIPAKANGVHSGTLVCLEWGDFSGTDLARATAALSGMKLGDKISTRLIEQDIGYWVYIPPQKDKAAVNRKIGELKKLGVKEYFVVQTPGQWMDAISLGVFKNRDSARNFLRELHTKGVSLRHFAGVGTQHV